MTAMAPTWAGCYCGPQTGIAYRQHVHDPDGQCPAEPVSLAAPEPTSRVDVTPDEVAEWPGVWAAANRMTGWTVTADPAHPEDAVASARKLSEATGRTVTVTGLVIRP